MNQRTIGPENAHVKPDLGALSHHEITLTLNTHTPLLLSASAKFQVSSSIVSKCPLFSLFLCKKKTVSKIDIAVK